MKRVSVHAPGKSLIHCLNKFLLIFLHCVHVCVCVHVKDHRDQQGPRVIKDQKPRERKETLGSMVRLWPPLWLVPVCGTCGDQVVLSFNCRPSWRERRAGKPRSWRYVGWGGFLTFDMTSLFFSQFSFVDSLGGSPSSRTSWSTWYSWSCRI